MGTAGAEGQLPLDQGLPRGDLLFRQPHPRQRRNGLGHIVGIQLADLGQGTVLPSGEHDLQPVGAGDGLQIALQNGVHLFQGQHLFHALQVPQDGLLRQGPEGGQAQQAHPVAHAQAANGLLAVQAAGAAGHHQLPGMVGAGIAVIGAAFKLLAQQIHFLKHGAAQIGHTDHAVPFAHLPHLVGLLRQLAQNHVAPAVADPGGQADNHHLVRPLRQRKGIGHHVLGLLHAGGLQHGDVGGHGLIPGVEFVGAGVGAGIVRGDNDHPALHTVLRAAVDRVRREQQSVLLHDTKRPRVGQRGPDAGLHGTGLIGGPLRVEISLSRHLAQHSQHLRRRGTGIRGREIDPGLQCAAHDGFIALHQTDLTGRVGCHRPFHCSASPFSVNFFTAKAAFVFLAKSNFIVAHSVENARTYRPRRSGFARDSVRPGGMEKPRGRPAAPMRGKAPDFMRNQVLYGV